MSRLLVAAIFIAIPVLTLCQQAQATAEQNVLFDSLLVDINVLSNSDIEITETQKYSFLSGNFHYGYRWIPLDAVDSIDEIQVYEDGHPYIMDPTVRQWIDDYQNAGEFPDENYCAYCTWTEGDNLWIGWWYPATKGGSRVFEIKYTVHGGLWLHEDGYQLYWQAIFSDRDIAIGSTKVTVHLPEPVSSTQLFIDSYGMEAHSNIVDDRTIEFTTGPLPDNTGLSIRVIFPHDIINTLPFDVGKTRGVGDWLVSVWAGLGAAFVLGGVLSLVVIRRRHPNPFGGPGYQD
jgi:hypothetical protein